MKAPWQGVWNDLSHSIPDLPIFIASDAHSTVISSSTWESVFMPLIPQQSREGYPGLGDQWDQCRPFLVRHHLKQRFPVGEDIDSRGQGMSVAGHQFHGQHPPGMHDQRASFGEEPEARLPTHIGELQFGDGLRPWQGLCDTGNARISVRPSCEELAVPPCHRSRAEVCHDGPGGLR